MHAIKSAALVLSALIAFVVWTAYHEGWMAPRISTSPLEPTGPNTEPPVAEYREVHSGIRGETGRLLTIDRAGRATLQTLSLGPQSKTMRTHLSCAELVDFPEAMKMEFREFRSDYGRNAPTNAEGQEEISIVDRWDGPEKRVVWHNAPSSPKPPEGSWAHVMVYFEDIKRRAEEDTGQAREKSRENAIVYGKSSSGIVGTYNYSLSIDRLRSCRSQGWLRVGCLPGEG